MRFLLDTNICIYAINHRPPTVIERIKAAGRGACGISAVTAAELAFGAVKSDRPDTRARLDVFLARFQILPWGAQVMWSYGELRVRLQRAGTPIGERDLMIAAHALSEDLILVTNNVREFERVAGLRIENWTLELPSGQA